jgi:hypothetical protein
MLTFRHQVFHNRLHLRNQTTIALSALDQMTLQFILYHLLLELSLFLELWEFFLCL